MCARNSARGPESDIATKLQERYNNVLQQTNDDVAIALRTMIAYARRLPYPTRENENVQNPTIEAMALVRTAFHAKKITQSAHDALIRLLTTDKIDPHIMRKRKRGGGSDSPSPGRAAIPIALLTVETPGDDDDA